MSTSHLIKIGCSLVLKVRVFTDNLKQFYSWDAAFTASNTLLLASTFHLSSTRPFGWGQHCLNSSECNSLHAGRVHWLVGGMWVLNLFMHWHYSLMKQTHVTKYPILNRPITIRTVALEDASFEALATLAINLASAPLFGRPSPKYVTFSLTFSSCSQDQFL
jgi:hypothetical protein